MKDASLVFLIKYKYHFLVWGIFIIYEIVISLAIGTLIFSWKEYVFGYFINICLFYFHANILLRYLLNTENRSLKYSLPIFILFEIICHILIKLFIETYVYQYIVLKTPDFYKHTMFYWFMRVWRTIYFIGIGTAYYFFKHNLRQRQQIEEMKEQELKTILLEKEIKNKMILTQNAQLRAQINPHFLINTLSYLYNETRKLVPKTAESILSLSDIMQYALSKEISSRYVRLENEIMLIENFLLLHQAKLPYKMQLKLSYNSATLSAPFIPLILMSLTENMIKHGQLNDPMKPAMIKITYDHSILFIETSNFMAMEYQISDQQAGLNNINSRLLLNYEGNAVFNFHLDSEKCFHTYTKVQF